MMEVLFIIVSFIMGLINHFGDKKSDVITQNKQKMIKVELDPVGEIDDWFELYT